MGTWVSGVVVAVIGFFAALAIANKTGAAQGFQFQAGSFFGFTSLGFGFAAVARFLKEDDQSELFVYASAFSAFGNAALSLLGIELVAEMWSSARPYVCIFNAFAVLEVVMVFVFSIASSSKYLLGLYAGVVLLGMVLLWSYRTCSGLPGMPMLKAMAAQLMISGILVELCLDDACGVQGYKHCWRDCPLPAPSFNHTVLFHVLYGIGFIILGILMYVAPDMLEAEVRVINRFFEADDRGFREEGNVSEYPEKGCAGCAKGPCSLM